MKFLKSTLMVGIFICLLYVLIIWVRSSKTEKETVQVEKVQTQNVVLQTSTTTTTTTTNETTSVVNSKRLTVHVSKLKFGGARGTH